MYFFASFPYKKSFLDKLDKIFHGCPFQNENNRVPPSEYTCGSQVTVVLLPSIPETKKKICFYFE